MNRKLFARIASVACFAVPWFFTGANAQSISAEVKADYPYVFDLYKHFHANPELSFKEKESSARIGQWALEIGGRKRKQKK